jgi:hypothetical protein
VPAYPITYQSYCPYTGMTLRDYFASKVMPQSFKDACRPSEKAGAAVRCYAIADAMIEARKYQQ